MTFDQDHVCPGCAVAHFARFAILFAIQPVLGALRRFEFEHHDALRFPIAFQDFCFASTDDVFSTVAAADCTGIRSVLARGRGLS
jgi:hypothetical protein